MFAGATAFDLLVLVLVVGLISAVMGWVGGAGARLSFSARCERLEAQLLQLLNRSKGQSGQARTQEARNLRTNAEEEARILYEQLRNKPGGPTGGLDWRKLSPEEQEVYFQKVATARGLTFKVVPK